MTTLFISHSSKDRDWAAKVRDKLCEADYQSLFLDFHEDNGIAAGANWEQTIYTKLRQCRGVVALCSEPWLASPWCVSEVILAREKGKPVFPLVAPGVCIPDFLKEDRQHIDLIGREESDIYAELLRGLAEFHLSDNFPLPERPYPGLEAFTATDAAVFFGRTDEIDNVLWTLNQRRLGNAQGFVVVLGSSGCGKSFLVRAGVLPRLGRTGVKNPKPNWILAEPFMAGRGLDGLAVSLAGVFAETNVCLNFATILHQIGATPEGRGAIEPDSIAFCRLCFELLAAHDANAAHLLLIVDQLEEVFATPEGSEARSLLHLLLAGTSRPGSPFVVLTTLRSDFFDKFQCFAGAAGNYEGLPLDPMPPSRFGEVIEGPADRFGLELEAGLTQRLVADTTYNDALPLLAYTMQKLYERCSSKGKLTIDEYKELFPEVEVREEDGRSRKYQGVAAAIKHVADRILDCYGYLARPKDDPRLRDLRRAFYRLAQVGEEGRFARRTAPWSGMPESCREVLEKFVKDRLLVSGRENGGRTLIVTHEALFRVWDTLHDWLVHDRAALRLRKQIEDEARDWDGDGRATDRWSNERIIEAVRVIEESGVVLDDVQDPALVRAFLGPTDRFKLEELLSLMETDDLVHGTGYYGAAWRLPLSHQARASVGVRLSLLGDHRRGVGLGKDGLPDIDWRPVEGGEVTIEIRENPLEPNSKVKNMVTRKVQPFLMARYPITIAQFQAFVEECYQNAQWRLPSELPFKFPRGYSVPKHRARYLNQPADTVSWYDAIAFCHWLTKKLGYEIRLPTEFEWQQAATGGEPSRIYPWGGYWDPEKKPWLANTYESWIVDPISVGLYPRGSSTGGLLDLAGNVWEWCLNAFDNPDDIGYPDSLTEGMKMLRVLRGGSSLTHHDYTRTFCRYFDHADYRSFQIGFRVIHVC